MGAILATEYCIPTGGIMSHRADPAEREIHDFYGRLYRVGQSDRELLGRSRAWMLAAACLAMLVAGVGQYGYAAMMPMLGGTRGWSLAASAMVLATWILCQSSTVYVGAEFLSLWYGSSRFVMLGGTDLVDSGL